MKSKMTQRRRLTAAALLSIIQIQTRSIHAWAPHYVFSGRPQTTRNHDGAIGAPSARRPRHVLYSSLKSEGDSSSSDVVDEDWREFRANLVRSESDNDEDNNLPSKPKDRQADEDHWAYETGDFVERGSIVISVPSSDDFLNDVDALNNVCYRKSIVLVLDASPNFIQGIVLNRPTNIGVKEGVGSKKEGMSFVQPGHGELFENDMGSCIGDECEIEERGASGAHSARWKVWFGGEVGGPYSDSPQVACLHSVATESARAVSDCVLPGIYITSYDGAQKIVQEGDANPSDFWLFCGICGWETSTFYREMQEEGLWHAVSADAETILEELNMLRCEEEEELAATQICDIDHDPRNAGLHTWEMLMEKIGLAKEAHESEDSFGDLMLHEWATGALSFSVKDEQTTSMITEPYSDPRFEDDEGDFDLSVYDPASAMSGVALEEADVQQSQGAGVMVRASSARRSPHLLSDQGLHKSLILILRDGDAYSEGILLNHVTTRTLPLDLGDREVQLPIRYGGPAYYFVEDEEDDDGEDEDEYEVPTVFLHSNDSLRDVGVGVPVGKSGLFRCTKEEVIAALKSGLAVPGDIMAVQGISVWAKKGDHTGVLGDVEAGFFELVPRLKVQQAWKALLLQEGLSEDSIDENVAKSRLAWNMASRDSDSLDDTSKKDEIHVFGTDIDVTTLADEAAIRWVRVNLL